MRWLRERSPAYRREAWRRALADQGVESSALAEHLGEAFGTERRARHEVFPDARPALEALAATHDLALLTNGASCLQREKLVASGLGDLFAVTVISADVGIGKPDPAAFHHALDRLGHDPEQATMIGDSVERDIEGALAAGIRAVRINRSGHPSAPGIRQVTTLAKVTATDG